MSIAEVRRLEEVYQSFEGKGDVFNLFPAITAFKEWHSAALVLFCDHVSDTDLDYIEFKNLDYGNNGYTMHTAFIRISGKYNLLMHKVERVMSSTEMKESENHMLKDKQPLIFISHSSKDKEFVEALVDLLEGIGMTSETLFCSSVQGYGVGLSKDIFETLRKLFQDYELYMIFVHSPRYYESTVSLNEMGAAWVLHTKCCSILTSDMDFAKMNGVINGNFISIKVNQDDASARLNELKDEIIKTFSLPVIDNNRWERKRNSFLKLVNSIVEQVQTPEFRQSTTSNAVDEEYKRLLIEKMRREEEERKQAQIRGNIVRGNKGGARELRIFNSGKAKASNVVLEWLNDSDSVLVQGDFNIGELSPQNKRSYPVLLCCGCPDVMHLRYKWSDELNTENVYEEQLQF